MENSRFYSNKITTISMILCFIALIIFISIPIIYQDSIVSEHQDSKVFTRFPADSENSASEPETDRFLGGLLSPQFDEESCISRYNSYLYHKTSPRNPSPYLLSKLRKYEKRHKRCGPDSKSYNKAVTELNSSRILDNSTSSCNYIVWLPSNGLGNRIVSMASGFLYALLTDRILLVKHGTDMADLFCEPFPNSSWLLPLNFPLRNLFDSSEMRDVHSFGNLLRQYNRNVSTSSVPSRAFLLLYLAYNYDDHDKLFYSDQNQEFLRKVRWLVLKSDQYFVPYLFTMSTFRKKLDRLFPDKDTVFHQVSRYLFHPSNQAWGLITRFYDAYLAKADERIGLQIRVFNPEASPSNLVMQQILSCTDKENLIPKLDRRKPEAYSLSKNQTTKAILVASLHSIYYENLRHMYWMKATLNGEIIGVFQASHEEFQHFGDKMHNLKAWAEMNVLSMMDVLVTSSWSTFGYVAQGLGGLNPWILFIPDNDNTRANPDLAPDPPCRRAISMEPCFHFPPSYDRKNNVRLEDDVDFGPYVRHCEDVSWGLKLVNNDYV
ncbi:galactoside 2-alpha-L-fucosyltransferase-like [Euphorbia lathyris]|uniref:galactoside 2-alpha-L-fucosyltransferase-like n=1 Tax=Euphorbia lathyris TaxID=212925 RepID=UPI00331372C0